MKQRKGFFWIGMLLAGTMVFRWVRRRLDPGAGNQPSSPAAADTYSPVAAAPANKASQQAPNPLAGATDNLEQINGIGATYARRLRAAGIQSFAALAALTPAEARELVRAQPWQADTAAWIAQAEERSTQ